MASKELGKQEANFSAMQIGTNVGPGLLYAS